MSIPYLGAALFVDFNFFHGVQHITTTDKTAKQILYQSVPTCKNEEIMKTKNKEKKTTLPFLRESMIWKCTTSPTVTGKKKRGNQVTGWLPTQLFKPCQVGLCEFVSTLPDQVWVDKVYGDRMFARTFIITNCAATSPGSKWHHPVAITSRDDITL